MAVMKSSPPVTITLRHSRVAHAAIVIAYGATASVLGLLPVPLVVRTAGVLLVVAACTFALRGLRRQAGAQVTIGLDRGISVACRERAVERGSVLGDAYVGAWLTTIVWRPGRSRLPRTLLVVRDAVERDSFRQLRVVLRYGSPRPGASAPSGVEAG